MDECRPKHDYKKNPNLFLVKTPSKNLNMAWTNSKDEKLAR
jgi:hypothetical protein